MSIVCEGKLNECLYDLLWCLDLRKILSKLLDGHVSSCTWLAHLYTKYVTSNPLKGHWFILRFNEDLKETMALLDQICFFQRIVFSCGDSYLFRPQLIFYLTTRLQTTTHGCSLPLWMWSTPIRDSLHHTAVLNMMLDPSICWRIDQWTRSMCEWSSFETVHDSAALVMENIC